jgi:uncharacterized protein YabE (DUF348 family)
MQVLKRLHEKQNLNTNKKITIKINGEKTAVLSTAKKIEALFPLFLEGKLNENDDGQNVHIFLTIAVNEGEA